MNPLTARPYHSRMYAEPPGFDRAALAGALRAGWGIEVAEMRYQPIGFGTHHYRVRGADGRDWFVNVDVLAAKAWLGGDETAALRGLARSFGTAAALREAGLEFIHAPRRTVDGDCLVPLAGGYAVSVSEVIEIASGKPDQRSVLAALGRMHATEVPAGLPRKDTLAVPLRQEFADPAATWAGGPYAEPARQLIAAHADRIRAKFDRYDALVPQVLSTSDSWVVTHGEPHSGNVLCAGDGGIRLVDWDTVALAPRERDLWLAAPGTTEGDPAALELYRLRWTLTEICIYTVQFRAPHRDDENTRAAWRGLRYEVE
jgi:spectinomycin phosphotransferase